MLKSFSNLPDDVRLAALNDLYATSCECAGYLEKGILIALSKNCTWEEITRWASKWGLCYLEGSAYKFSLGSDTPAEHLRHDGPYNGRSSYWYYATFCVKE